LKKVGLKRTKCDPDDRACYETACRTQCCEESSCSFYQFEMDTDTPAIEDESSMSMDVPSMDEKNDVFCHVGEKHQLTDVNCEKPYFGEACIGRIPKWPQEGKDHTKCISGYSIGEGFVVEDQLDCQATAVDNGDDYYQYNADKKTCATCTNLGDLVLNSINPWKIFKKPAEEGHGTPQCADWQLKSTLLSKIKGTKMVRPGGRGCRGNSVACLKKRCRQACSAEEICTFYQFQEGINQCYLGFSSTLNDTMVESNFYGGFVSSERKCKEGFQCPSTNQCVSACEECPGYSQDGPEQKGRGKNKGKWCLRDAVQSLCFADNWVESYQGIEVDHWCRGLEKVTVKVNETLDEHETGEKICRASCCSDPDCALYQMNPAQANLSGSEIKKGMKISCWLGMETAGGKPKFKCSGRKLKRWRMWQPPVASALSKRGCTGGSIACLTKKQCVDICRTECMGAENQNRVKGVCEPDSSMEEENLNTRSNLAFKSNLVSSFPKLAAKKKDAYYVDPNKNLPLDSNNEPSATFYSKDQILHMQLHSSNVANPLSTQDLSAACDGLKDNDLDDEWLCWFENAACICEFEEAKECHEWFADNGHLKHMVGTSGMLLFGGDLCECTTQENSDGAFTCSFGLLDKLPPLSPNAGAEAQLTLAGQNAPTCTKENVCADMSRCTMKMFGKHACGYECFGATDTNQEYWCDAECNCHKEDETNDCKVGTVCPKQKKCNVIDYGSYGCGFGCEDDNGDFSYCSQDCVCE